MSENNDVVFVCVFGQCVGMECVHTQNEGREGGREGGRERTDVIVLAHHVVDPCLQECLVQSVFIYMHVSP